MSGIRASRRKFHIIYKTTCLATGKWYIGMHSTDDLNDGYMGSGQQLRRSVAKHGKDRHKTEVLEFLPDRESLWRREEELVTKKLMEDECMNLATGGQGKADRPLVTKESTSAKLSETGKQRWSRDRTTLKQELDEQLATFSMTREEVLAALIQPDGKLSKNATRALLKLQAGRLAGQNKHVLAKREHERLAKWAFVLEQIENPLFGPDLVQQIDAYVHERSTRPTCKVCNTRTTFFRFGESYGVYCGARCQLNDPSFKNPVLSQAVLTRYHHQGLRSPKSCIG